MNKVISDYDDLISVGGIDIDDATFLVEDRGTAGKYYAIKNDGISELIFKGQVMPDMGGDDGNEIVVDTATQHVSMLAQAAVASTLYRRYEWVSVIDAVTTAVCRERNGKIYIYGEGPIPPAHPRCRSSIVPITVGNDLDDVPASYYAWIKKQPKSVQDDILGVQEGKKLREGQRKARDYPN
jgi:SPP1 gp7 family putative phage head morphogenesis protein